MIVLYHCADTRSFRALWMLEELGLEYDLKMLAFPPRIQAPDYLELNPLGTVPLLIDGTTRMTESVAIVQYLAIRHGPTALAVDEHDEAYGEWLNWLHFGEASLTFAQSIILRYRTFEPGRAIEAVDDYTRVVRARLKQVSRALDREWLCAERFTAADISVGYALLLADHLARHIHGRHVTGLAIVA